MKQSLQLKLGQHLTMTPQLQQAIRLLQLSTLELQHEIQEALDSNPLLELIEPGGGDDATPGATAGPEQESGAGPAADAPEPDVAEHVATEAIPADLAVDTNWDDIYETTGPSTGSGADDEGADFESYTAAATTLADHLLWQLNLTPMSDTDRAIATTLIDAIDADGMLGASVEEIAASVAPDGGVEIDEVLAVLHRIQHFDPPGVAARDLRECLLLQLAQLADEPLVRLASTVVDRHLQLLGARDYATLLRRLRVGEPELKAAIDLIRQLNPRPGSALGATAPEYIVPDVLVGKRNGRWTVELNPDIAPRLRINAQYAALIRRADSSADNLFLRDNLQEAKWFIKSLQSRNETLLKVATCIVERQQGFLEHGPEAMRPMILHDVATAVNMHESTISRVTTQKYMHTPRGIFELKYFFSSHVGTAAGGECSSVAIRAIIRKLVAAENPRKPLSDSKIAEILEEQGINVARRTIAKYREALSIPPSNERKQLV
ncbi:MAG: RNA polymerase sigma-54 factor [Pseudomonadales bacterium]|nr:RNA polymerase sigma-54 factor [Pseudomonadales bacterium]